MSGYVSPNNSPIVGTYERVYGVAVVTEISEDGTPVYEGSTDLYWNSQETVYSDGETLWVDEDGDTWVFSELTRVDSSDCDNSD